MVHLPTMWQIAVPNDPSISMSSVFIPHLSKLWQPDSAASVYIEESTFFLQWDYIVIVVAGGLYAPTIMDGMYGYRDGGFAIFTNAALVLAFSVASILFSPGLVYAVVLYFREDFLREDHAKKHGKRLVHDKGLVKEL